MKSLATTAAVLAFVAATPAWAGGFVAEANGAHVAGDWGGEIEGGVAFGAAGFNLTPLGGVFLHSGETDVYGKVEATYSIPLGPTLGAGVRVDDDRTRPYATVALPLAPLVRVKANVGDRYYALGLRLSF